MGIEVFPLPATGPSLAEITTAITTNAAPSSVTMPAITSSITTNAASSGVTMAAITSAITTNAASSGVTLAAIGTQVANNASPFGGTWTNVAVANPASVNFITVSSIGGYKFLKILVALSTVPANEELGVRFNGDSGSNYVCYWGNGNSGFQIRTAHTELVMGGNPGYGGGFALDVFSANGTTHEKVINITGSISAGVSLGYGLYRSNSAITSLSLFNRSGIGNFSGIIRVMGAN